MRTIYDKSVIDEATEERLWREGIIVFDTCALLDFYNMTREYQEIMADILKYMSDIIWLPAQVMYEYEKNRVDAIKKPASEIYHNKTIENNHFVRDLKDLIGQWEKKYFHPFIDEGKLTEIKEALAIIEPKIADIKKAVSLQYQARVHEIYDIPDNDKLAEAIRSLEHGSPFTFHEMKEIVKEGCVRYANQIGPGYEDAEKRGIRKYGDLIIWKEIIRYAKENQKAIILVTSETKPDWVIVDETKDDPTADKPIREELGNPRRDMLTEFEEETGQRIWFYKPTAFIKMLEKSFKPQQEEIQFYGELGVVRNVLARIERERMIKHLCSPYSLLVRCGSCGELFECPTSLFTLDWDSQVVDTDRDMGDEIEHVSEEFSLCSHCGAYVGITLKVWEYPAGIIEYQDIEVDGGKLEKPVDLAEYIDLGNYGECVRCGTRAILNEDELCDQCEADFKECMNEDD